jgi:hypothetical protein
LAGAVLSNRCLQVARPRIDTLVDEQRVFAPDLVKEELDAVGTGELSQWADDRAGIWVPTADLLAAALGTQDRFPGLRDPKAEYEEADAYVIALAQLRSGIVVTQETSAAEKRNPRRPMSAGSWAFPASVSSA